MLFKSVFAKYMVAFMCIILVSFTILALVISGMVQQYATSSKRDDIDNMSNAATTMISADFAESEYGDFEEYVLSNRTAISRNISAISRYASEIYIIVTNESGKILVYDSQLVDESIHSDFPVSFAKDVIRLGKLETESTFKGVFDRKHYTIAIPIMSGEKAVGIVFTCSLTSTTDAFVNNTLKMMLMACMWVMCAAIIASYFISERTTRPLKNMSRAAKEFERGRYDVRVEVKGSDEIAELAIAFNNMASAIETNEEMRSIFLANVAHDLRTPMTTIGGFVDSILNGAIPPDKYDHYLGIIKNEVVRLSRLVNMLLDITKIQSGERKFTMEPFDICELARRIIISFEQRIDDKKLDVEFLCDDERMVAVADYDAIYQILYNICDNAVKFSKEEGKYKLSIVYDDDRIKVSVYNEGQGIPESDLPYVFERFYKSDKSRGLDKSGVGLGLFISKTIIDAHGEKISVRSEEGVFCEFSFTLKIGQLTRGEMIEKSSKKNRDN